MPNRLSQAQSLYLRKHGDNPIDWWPWCEEALAMAAQTDRPIFLSVGYSSCHWCTVMEGEAFSNPAIAQYLNENFLPIKVDREERPDLDSIYMQALQMMIGQGGWPLHLFLTPDERIPFYGGTYFPVEPRYGRPGFLQVLQALHRFYQEEKDKLQGIKTEILSTLQRSTLLPKSPESVLKYELLQQAIVVNTSVIKGSTPGHPSFPMIPYSDFVLRGSRFPEEITAHNAAYQRGEDLALGGIYDHVGGGFHRYTVDATWTVPHFEKMLYDNGQIMEYLANLWSAGDTKPAYKRAIDGTIQWLKREMTAPRGYFYAAQDADSFATSEDKEPEEGAFYVWKYEELQAYLTSEELAALEQEFMISEKGNFEGSNVLQRRRGGVLSEVTEQALSKLFIRRYGAPAEAIATFPPARDNQEAKTKPWPGRIPAVTDTKMIVAWNSLMISGLARAYSVFKDPLPWHMATQAAQFILKYQWVEGRFYRLNYEGNATILAQSEDYTLFIKALLDLYQTSVGQGRPEEQWRESAIALQQELDQYLWDSSMGGYYNTPSDASSDLIIRERSYMDNATPSANGVAVSNLVRLALCTDEEQYLQRAEETLMAFSTIMEQSPQACPTLFTGLDWFLCATLVRTRRDTLKSLSPQYFPSSVYQLEETLPENTVGLVCKGLSCLTPATNQSEFLEQIHQILIP
ncbi:thioredoxin domain-containing protein [Spirulina subsalsa]|uniref:thioredoxin domain-containing protein n=1 Tax=Spirulina subsalsa TaxID=54311 RepID=UPI0003116358|nr:thioredoxin domain-containing protein [Spirulina subsalsa]